MQETKAALIIGGSGYLGTHLSLRLRERYKVFATFQTHMMRIPGVTPIPIKLENRVWLKRIIYMIRPEVVIFAAGSNDVGSAEKNTRAAQDIHTSGAGNVAQVADIFQPKFIYLSNCYVFDGNRGNYHETDTVLPGTALGKAKLGGENLIRTRSLNHIILRSSPTLGRGSGRGFSFLDEIRFRLDRGMRVELSEEEYHSFVAVDGLVDLIERLCESGIKNRIMNYGGLTKLSAFDMGKKFAERFGYDSKLIVPRMVAQKTKQSSGTRPTRALDYSLNSSYVVENLKIKPLFLEESFDLIEKHLISRT